MMEADNNVVVAPFVMKTYEMVDDPATVSLITWGQSKNTFVVVDPSDFSLRVLPCYFKHSNFSSFVRQLNTYGFRKVDPDRWEFANANFLRGHTHLLRNIVRRKHGGDNLSSRGAVVTRRRGEDEEIVMEICKLKEEQEAMEREIEGMSRRLEATERRPQQMMAFLRNVAGDADSLSALVGKRRREGLADKRRRSALAPTSQTASFAKGRWDDEAVVKEEEGWGGAGGDGGGEAVGEWGGGGEGVGFVRGAVAPFGVVDVAAPPYPFSLLGGGF